MANEYKLSYTAQEIDEKLGQISTPDWEQNDPRGEGYIKNRPFYTDGSAFTFEPTEMGVVSTDFELSPGESYVITFNLEDGSALDETLTAVSLEEYIGAPLEGFEDADKIMVLDNGVMSGELEENDPMFVIYNNCELSNEGYPIYKPGTSTYMVMNAQSAILLAGSTYKLDKKYLPTEILSLPATMSNMSETLDNISDELNNKVKTINQDISYSSNSEEYPTVYAMQKYVDNKVKKEKFETVDTGGKSITLDNILYETAGLKFFDVVKYDEGTYKYTNAKSGGETHEGVGVSSSTSISEIIIDETGISVIRKPSAFSMVDSNTIKKYEIAENNYSNVTSYVKHDNRYYFIVPATEAVLQNNHTFYSDIADDYDAKKRFLVDEDSNIYYYENFANIDNLNEIISQDIVGGFNIKIPQGVNVYSITRNGSAKHDEITGNVIIGNAYLKSSDLEDTGEDFLFYWDATSKTISLYIKGSACLDDTLTTISKTGIAYNTNGFKSLRLFARNETRPISTLSMIVYYDISKSTFVEFPQYVFPRLTDKAKFVYCNGYFYLFGGKIKKPNATSDLDTVYNSRIFRNKYTTDIYEVDNFETLKTRLFKDTSNQYSVTDPCVVVDNKIYYQNQCIDTSNPDCIHCYRSNVVLNAHSVAVGDSIVSKDGIYNTITDEFTSLNLPVYGIFAGTHCATIYDNIYFAASFSGTSGPASVTRVKLDESILNTDFSKIRSNYNENNSSSIAYIENKPFSENKQVKLLALLSGDDINWNGSADVSYYDTFDNSFLYLQNTDVISDGRRYAMEFRYSHEKNDKYYNDDNVTYRMCVTPKGANKTLIWDFEKPNKDFYSEIMGITGKYSGNPYLFSGDMSQDNGQDFCYMIVTSINYTYPYSWLSKHIYLCFDNKRLYDKYGVTIPARHDNQVNLDKFSLYATEITSDIKKLDSKYLPDYMSKTEVIAYVAEQIAALKAELQGT